MHSSESKGRHVAPKPDPSKPQEAPRTTKDDEEVGPGITGPRGSQVERAARAAGNPSPAFNVSMSRAGVGLRSKSKAAARGRRHLRVRKRVTGTTIRPRLVVNRSTRHVFVQVIDDTRGITLASASTLEMELRSFDGDKVAKAKRVGELIAARTRAAGIGAVVFDRGGNRYHGRIAAVADGAREAGLRL